MALSRRKFLQLAAGAASLNAWPSLSVAGLDADGFTRLVASPVDQLIYQDGGATSALWGYNGGSPGPALRIKQGQPAKFRLDNQLPVPTTIHWHGIRLANAMDGVSGLTQPAVQPGETFDYVFTAPDPGTYWYHAHHRSWEQVARGLYGALIVEEPDPVFPPDQDLTLILDDWRLDGNGALELASLGSAMDWSHAGRLGNWPTVNGRTLPTLPVEAGKPYRLRIINAANARVFQLALHEFSERILAIDGRNLAEQRVVDGGITALAPAQRIDVLMVPSEGVSPTINEYTAPQQPFAIANWALQPAGAAPRLPGTLASTRFELDSSIETKIALNMSGGAMGQMQSMIYQGAPLDRNKMMETKQFWAFNSVSNLADDPLFSAELGTRITIETQNNTAWPHAIHLHGHHFKILTSDNEVTDETGMIRDTFLIEPEKRVTIGFIADNPGKWLLHCHMLEHAAAGMVTWFNVEA